MKSGPLSLRIAFLLVRWPRRPTRRRKPPAPPRGSRVRSPLALPAETQSLLPDPATGRKGTRRLRHFPWFATFGENRPRVNRLNEMQVNLLANLASWTVTNQDSVDRIVEAFGGALPVPVK